MKLVVFSDVHGNKYSFYAFLEQLDRLDHDKVIFCGDVFGYYYYTEEIVREMIARRFHCLLGNHDAMLLAATRGEYSEEHLKDLVQCYGSVYDNIGRAISGDTIRHLAICSPKLELKLPEGKIGIFHGTPEDPLNGRLYPDTPITNSSGYDGYDCIILGHTHHKMVRHLNRTVILNPGSLGQQRDGRGCSYLLIDTVERDYQFRIVEYDPKDLIEDIHRNDPDKDFLASVLTRTPKRRENEGTGNRL